MPGKSINTIHDANGPEAQAVYHKTVSTHAYVAGFQLGTYGPGVSNLPAFPRQERE